MTQPNFTDIPLAKIEENKGQIPGLPANPRKVDRAKLDALKESITTHPEMLSYRGLMVYPYEGRYIVIGGNMRLRALKALKQKTAPCIIIPETATPEQLKDYTLLDNAPTGEWDLDMIEQDWGLDLFDKWQIDLPEAPELTEEAAEAKDDGFIEPAREEVKTDIVPGDLFEIRGGGRVHRLLCGDSTDPEQVARLMGGQQADLILTDPPYNVGYNPDERFPDPSFHRNNSKRAKQSIANDKMSEAEYRDFIGNTFAAADSVTRPGAAVYCWYAIREHPTVETAFSRHFVYCNTLIWVKDNFSIGWADYQNQYEPCLYGWKDGDTHYFTLDRSNSTVIERAKYHLSEMKAPELRRAVKELLRERDRGTDVIRVDKPLSSDLHPTQKPVELFGYLMKNSSKEGWAVLDPFLGSGTTMVTAHQLRRNAYGLELDPIFCQIILDRMRTLDPDIEIAKVEG